MQAVIHLYRNKSRVFNMLEGLYKYCSDTDYMIDDILWLDESFRDLCDILQSRLLIFRMPEIKDMNLSMIEAAHTGTHRLDKLCDSVRQSVYGEVAGDVSPAALRSDTKEVTVLFSGGKDSAAVAFHYKKLGYKVHLYHAAGVNKAYGDEKRAAQRIADYLGCDLFIDNIRLEGTHRFIEHPLKNYVIANGALHYCLNKGYAPVLATGNFNRSILDMNEFEVCGGDCIEMWDAYKKIIQSVLPEFDLLVPLETNADTFEILRNDWELFSLAVSCMSPFRFREHWKHRTEQKYNVKIFENRCGCCWKCCLEAMWLMDNNEMQYDEPFYLHCIKILENTIKKETGSPADCLQDIWDNYMFYPLEQSKAYEQLMEYEVHHPMKRKKRRKKKK